MFFKPKKKWEKEICHRECWHRTDTFLLLCELWINQSFCICARALAGTWQILCIPLAYYIACGLCCKQFRLHLTSHYEQWGVSTLQWALPRKKEENFWAILWYEERKFPRTIRAQTGKPKREKLQHHRLFIKLFPFFSLACQFSLGYITLHITVATFFSLFRFLLWCFVPQSLHTLPALNKTLAS